MVHRSPIFDMCRRDRILFYPSGWGTPWTINRDNHLPNQLGGYARDFLHGWGRSVTRWGRGDVARSRLDCRQTQQ